MKTVIKKLYRNARTAIARRRVYRRMLDLPRDFVLRCTANLYASRGQPPLSLALPLHLNQLDDPLYLRVANSDFLVLAEIFDRGEYVHVNKWNLPPAARIIDLGANIGLASAYFASLYPQCRVIAVEPDKDNCRLIARNCRRLINENRIQIVQGFAAATDGQAGLDRDVRAWAFHKVETVDSSHEAVPCFSMESLLKRSGFEQVDLLKCDIEGSERELFAACENWIGRVQHLIVETHHPYLVKDLLDDLRRRGWGFEVTFELQEEHVGIAFLRHTSRQFE